jgi:predicted glutamine amidotransferase
MKKGRPWDGTSGHVFPWSLIHNGVAKNDKFYVRNFFSIFQTLGIRAFSFLTSQEGSDPHYFSNKRHQSLDLPMRSTSILQGVNRLNHG